MLDKDLQKANGKREIHAKKSKLERLYPPTSENQETVKISAQENELNDNLIENERIFRSIFDNANDIITFVTRTGRILELNKKIKDILGYEPNELIGKNFLTCGVLAARNASMIIKLFSDAVIRGGFPDKKSDLDTTQVWLNHKDGNAVEVEVSTTPIRKNGKIEGFVSILRDITERKKAEQRKQEYIHELQFLSESAVQFVSLTPDRDIYSLIAEKIHELNRNSIVAVNTYDETYDGLHVRALVGLGKYMRAVSEIMGSNPVGRCFPLNDAAKEGLGQGKLHKIPNGIYDVSPGIPKVICQAIEKLLGLGDVYAMGLNSEGRLYGSATIFTRGNTGLKNHELLETFMNQAAVAIRRWEANVELSRSEAKWRALTENSSDFIMLLDRDATVLFINHTTQLTPQEVIGRQVYEFVPPEYRDAAKKCVEEVFQTGKSLEFETGYRTPSGDFQTFEARLGPVMEKGKVIAVTVGARDITQKKKAEEALISSEEKYKALFDNSIEGIGLAKGNRIISANKALLNIFGYDSLEELVSIPLLDHVAPESKEMARDIMSKRQKGLMSDFSFVYKIKRKDGKLRDLEISGTKVQIEGEYYTLSTLRDITETKRIGEALKENEEKLRLMAETIEDVFWMSTPSVQKMIFISSSYEKIWGRSCQTLYDNPKSFLEVVHPEDRDYLLDIINEFHASGKQYSCEYRIIPSDGRLRWISERGFPVHDEHGNLLYMTGICTDITERKKAEEALREREEMFRSIFETSLVGVAICSTDKKWLYVNKKICKILGYSEQELRQTTWDKLTHPDDLEADVSQYNRLLAGEIDNYSLEKRFIRKDGSVIYARIYISCKNNQYGAVEYNIGLLEDITERKKAEEALKNSESRYRELFNGINNCVAVYEVRKDGAEFIFKDLNHATEKIEKLEKKNMLGKNVTEIFPGIEEFGLLEVFREVWRTGKPQHFPIKHYKDERIAGWRENYVYKLSSDEIVAVYEDVTERKRTEERIFNYQEQLKSLASQLTLTEEKERYRIATAIHDQIGQYLAVSRIKLDELKFLTDSEEARKILEQISQWLYHAIEETRLLTSNLSSPILYELGFERAVAAWLNDEIQKKHNIETKFHSDGLPKRLDEDIRVLLFRNVRELLFNIVKHAQAKNVNVSISTIDNTIKVTVEDDGVGFDPAEVAAKSAGMAKFGLFSIRERLEHYGGHLQIDSAPGKGSRITLIAPLKNSI